MRMLITPPENKVDITVTISDESSNPVEGAAVTLKRTTLTPYTGESDASGECELTDVYVGAYNVTVTATGYQDYVGSVTVDDDTSTLDVTILAERTVTITVEDGEGNKVQGATVTIGEDEETTDASGKAEFTGLSDKTYNVTVEADHFTSVTVEKTVDSTHTSFTIEITEDANRTLRFHIEDEDGEDVDGATVTVDDYSPATSGAKGGCSISKVYDGEHELEVTKTGYVTVTKTIITNEDNDDFIIILVAE